MPRKRSLIEHLIAARTAIANATPQELEQAADGLCQPTSTVSDAEFNIEHKLHELLLWLAARTIVCPVEAEIVNQYDLAERVMAVPHQPYPYVR